jgi:hypothetical protein
MYVVCLAEYEGIKDDMNPQIVHPQLGSIKVAAFKIFVRYDESIGLLHFLWFFFILEILFKPESLVSLSLYP